MKNDLECQLHGAGFVQLAIDKRSKQKEKVAIKFWPRDPEVITEDVQREVHNHSRFRHPNVIQFKEVFLTPTHLGLAMEPAKGGDLFKRVKACKGVSETEARLNFQQLLLAVDYCHKMGMANRDIKLENVLLANKKSPPTIKLTDFGFCKSDRDSIPRQSAARLATWTSMKCCEASNFPPKPQISTDVKDLILKMVTRTPEDRIKLEDVCSHAWVAQGLPTNYLAQNDEYMRAAGAAPHTQSIEELDRLLEEAGLQLPQRGENDLHVKNGVSLGSRKGLSGDAMEW